MDALLGKRKILKGRITRIETVAEGHRNQPLQKTGLQLYVRKLEELNKEIDEWQCDIVEESEEESYAEHETAYNEMVTRIERLSIFFANELAQGPLTEQGGPGRVGAEVRLPRLELPTFGGKYEDWIPFRDLFTATVYTNASLSGAQKLQYLRASLKDEAALLILSIPLTDANYNEAWEMLENRFDNHREIVDAHVRRLFEQPPATCGSATELRRLIDSTAECTRTLKVLGEPVQHWDTLLLHIVKGKLDSESVKQWELSRTGKKVPPFSDLTAFLEQRARALAASQVGLAQSKSICREKSTRAAVTPFRNSKMATTVHHGSTAMHCNICGENHFNAKCPTFLQADLEQRRQMVKRNSLCYNCLRPDHLAANCKAGPCRKCKYKHHSLLHRDHTVEEQKPTVREPEVTSHVAGEKGAYSQILLSTAIVWLRDVSGQLHPLRALLDSASQASFITQKCVQRLQLKTNHIMVSVTGLGHGKAGPCKGKTNFTVYTREGNTQGIFVEALVLEKITKALPTLRCDPAAWTHLQNIPLADPTFHTPGEVDLLLGADVYMDVILDGQRRGPKGTPSAIRTIFGWTILGTAGSVSNEPVVSLQCSVEERLCRFWELEEIADEREQWTEEEKCCEKHFIDTHDRDTSGRYIVRLPLKTDGPVLGESRGIAVRRFLHLEKRLRERPALGNNYREFMKEYIDLGHMELVPKEDEYRPVGKVCYLPHHAVIKEASLSTKLRVVFDASAKTSNGTSLNDTLLVGPKLQEDIFAILVRFRVPKIAMSADIAKMYRQIRVNSQDTDYQRIVWREDHRGPIREYRLLTVTYGTSSASYIATRVLRQLSIDEREEYPESSRIFNEDFYMDDLMTGMDTKEDAVRRKSELITIAARGGFELRKWVSNEPELMESTYAAETLFVDPLHLKHDEYVKTLGLLWLPVSDHFTFSVNSQDSYLPATKRVVLADTARVFDPLGLLSPVTIRAKVIMQDLWKVGAAWDELLQRDLQLKWNQFRSELQMLDRLEIPRCVRPFPKGMKTLHGFCDASESAYAAAVYLKTLDEGECCVRLLAAKTRVAPVKITTIPRLELCGALLLTRLLVAIKRALKTEDLEIQAWCDSTIVLAWLSSEPRRWKTFVAHRVAEIQESLPRPLWHHVEGKDNPADCASRGVKVFELQNHPLWWNGPPFLQADGCHPEEITTGEPEECFQEERTVTATTLVGELNDGCILSKYSSLSKLKRVTAFVMCFVNNCRMHDPALRCSGPLTVTEINSAMSLWIRREQKRDFQMERERLKKGLPLPRENRIAQLSPLVDHEDILRVGGRLGKAKLTTDQTHPVLLLRTSKLTELLIDYEHIRLLHAGPQLVLATLQSRFWIIGARNAVRFRLRKCVICARQRAETVQQIMAELPRHRVQPGRPFLRCGVDYAGPFQLRVIKGRGHRLYKGYVAVFVCFATRAIHLEVVSDQSAEAFMAALKRFVSRRGRCKDIYSDCGSNFVGAAREIKEFAKMVEAAAHQGSVANWLLEENIRWHFNPPSAPHFGGLWEAGVKSLKYHLRRTMGDIKLTYEEMQTLLCQIESCLNSRPLTSFSTDPQDLTVLTPGHFLIGEPLAAIPEPSLEEIPLNRLDRWQVGQRVLQHFWRRWQGEYLTRLQQRPKWLGKKTNLQVGDLVLVKDSDLPPTKWRLGRVMQLHAGQDGMVRVVTLKTSTGCLKRPVTKLCLLPLDHVNGGANLNSSDNH